MNRYRTLLVLVLLVAAALPARAGIFFNRKPKQNPNERAAQLITALRTEQDDRKRASAAEDLRQFDANAHPEVLSALIDCALHDKSAHVRAEAVHSLGKLRPITQQAGWALEQIVAKDSAVRVQVQARSALLSYRMSGYRSSKNGEPPPIKTEEPPLAEATAPPRVAAPLAPEPPQTVQVRKQRSTVPAPMPSPVPALAPAPLPPLAKPPEPPRDGGPVLNSPK